MVSKVADRGDWTIVASQGRCSEADKDGAVKNVGIFGLST
jgi:hypothetical protein